MLKPGTGSAFALSAIASRDFGGSDADCATCAVGSVPGAFVPVAAPTSSMTAIAVPVATVVPSCTKISRSVPVTGAGTSELTLSVETSTKASYFSTESPAFLSHRSTVPSVTVSPSCGIVIVVATSLEPHHFAHRLGHLGRRTHILFLERKGVAHSGDVRRA